MNGLSREDRYSSRSPGDRGQVPMCDRGRGLWDALTVDQQSTTRIVGSRTSRSARSELITVASCRRAVSTTVASMTSVVPAVPHSTPAARAPGSVSGSTRTSRALSSRPSLAWRPPPLHAWPTTPAGTTTARCCRRATSITAAVSRSPRSIAIRAPASRTKVNVARPGPDAGGLG